MTCDWLRKVRKALTLYEYWEFTFQRNKNDGICVFRSKLQKKIYRKERSSFFQWFNIFLFGIKFSFSFWISCLCDIKLHTANLISHTPGY